MALLLADWSPVAHLPVMVESHFIRQTVSSRSSKCLFFLAMMGRPAYIHLPAHSEHRHTSLRCYLTNCRQETSVVDRTFSNQICFVAELSHMICTLETNLLIWSRAKVLEMNISFPSAVDRCTGAILCPRFNFLSTKA